MLFIYIYICSAANRKTYYKTRAINALDHVWLAVVSLKEFYFYSLSFFSHDRQPYLPH